MANWSASAAANRCRLTSAGVRDQRRPATNGGRRTFRADLLDRLAFDVVQLPPLRERQSDIMLLATQFAIQMCRELGLPLFPGFSERAAMTLQNYRWPGNIRELKTWLNARSTATAAASASWIILLLTPSASSTRRRPSKWRRRLAPRCRSIYALSSRSRKSLLERSLEQAKYNQKQAAELLGLTYHQLRALLKNISFDLYAEAAARSPPLNPGRARR